MKWPKERLFRLILPVQNWNPQVSCEDSFIYVDISSVDANQKKIVAAKTIPCVSAPSRARQLVNEGDVLVSTVRPNLNCVASVQDDLNGATASTGFCVLRCDKAVLDQRYLFHWVQSKAFVGDMVSKATGASYPAVSDAIIHASELPLPPLEEQRRIAAILDKAEQLILLGQKSGKTQAVLRETVFSKRLGTLLNPQVLGLLCNWEKSPGLKMVIAQATTPAEMTSKKKEFYFLARKILSIISSA